MRMRVLNGDGWMETLTECAIIFKRVQSLKARREHCFPNDKDAQQWIVHGSFILMKAHLPPLRFLCAFVIMQMCNV